MPVPITDPTLERELQAKFRPTSEIHDLGVQLMHQILRRAHPDATEQEIDQRLQALLHERPGAEWGDVASKI